MSKISTNLKTSKSTDQQISKSTNQQIKKGYIRGKNRKVKEITFYLPEMTRFKEIFCIVRRYDSNKKED